MASRSVSNTLKVLAAGSLLAVGLSAYAGPGERHGGYQHGSNAECSQKDGKGGYGKHHAMKQMRNAGMMVPGYGPVPQRVVDSLALNDEQKALVATAKAEQDAVKAAHREAMKQGLGQRGQLLQDGSVDPRAAVQARQAHRDQMQVQAQQVQQKWLAVWDALSAEQQQTLATHFKDRAEKFQEHMRRHAERHSS